MAEVVEAFLYVFKLLLSFPQSFLRKLTAFGNEIPACMANAFADELPTVVCSLSGNYKTAYGCCGCFHIVDCIAKVAVGKGTSEISAVLFEQAQFMPDGRIGRIDYFIPLLLVGSQLFQLIPDLPRVFNEVLPAVPYAFAETDGAFSGINQYPIGYIYSKRGTEDFLECAFGKRFIRLLAVCHLLRQAAQFGMSSV